MVAEIIKIMHTTNLWKIALLKKYPKHRWAPNIDQLVYRVFANTA